MAQYQNMYNFLRYQNWFILNGWWLRWTQSAKLNSKLNNFYWSVDLNSCTCMDFMKLYIYGKFCKVTWIA
jgi:hypothetical protein